MLRPRTPGRSRPARLRSHKTFESFCKTEVCTIGNTTSITLYVEPRAGLSHFDFVGFFFSCKQLLEGGGGVQPRWACGGLWPYMLLCAWRKCKIQFFQSLKTEDSRRLWKASEGMGDEETCAAGIGGRAGSSLTTRLTWLLLYFVSTALAGVTYGPLRYNEIQSSAVPSKTELGFLKAIKAAEAIHRNGKQTTDCWQFL